VANSDTLWLEAEREADEPSSRNAGLWARCFAQAEGDSGKAKALYMSERVRQMGGREIKAKPQSQITSALKYGLALLVLMFAAVMVFGFMLPDNSEQSGQRAAIELCWKDHQNPALDEATKRFVAQTCNGLAAEYRAKYSTSP
jgi:hypothetical protein